MKTLAVLLVWLLVGIGALGAFVLFPIAWWVEEIVYGKNLLRALDKTSAAFLGFTGEYTVSAECGAATGGWPAQLRIAIDWLLGEGHCTGAARHEGLPLTSEV